MDLTIFPLKFYTLFKTKFLSILQLFLQLIFQVILIHKKKFKLEESSYRPISLLSNVHKIFEKLMYRKTISLLQKALDDEKIPYGLFIDLEKAFDIASYDILLEKLDLYGIRNISNNWFRFYLSDRFQFVSINGFNPDYKTCSTGFTSRPLLQMILVF